MSKITEQIQHNIGILLLLFLIVAVAGKPNHCPIKFAQKNKATHGIRKKERCSSRHKVSEKRKYKNSRSPRAAGKWRNNSRLASNLATSSYDPEVFDVAHEHLIACHEEKIQDTHENASLATL